MLFYNLSCYVIAWHGDFVFRLKRKKKPRSKSAKSNLKASQTERKKADCENLTYKKVKSNKQFIFLGGRYQLKNRLSSQELKKCKKNNTFSKFVFFFFTPKQL
jgi:hypothetical protein